MPTHFLITTALAAATFLRSLAGFGFPLFAPTMYNALGFGKSDTILAVTAIVLGCPACVEPTVCFLHMFNFSDQAVATLVLWRADTKCQSVCSKRQPLDLSDPQMPNAMNT
jgi:hypothetical protein